MRAPFDAFILDMQLPDGNSLDLIREDRRSLDELSRVHLSAVPLPSMPKHPASNDPALSRTWTLPGGWASFKGIALNGSPALRHAPVTIAMARGAS